MINDEFQLRRIDFDDWDEEYLEFDYGDGNVALEIERISEHESEDVMDEDDGYVSEHDPTDDIDDGPGPSTGFKCCKCHRDFNTRRGLSIHTAACKRKA